MIKGIGVDLVEIERIEQSLESNQRFLQRILTENEQALLKNITASKRQAEFVAGRFAAKEAFAKAMGTGIGKEYSFLDITVSRTDQGAPVIDVKNFPFKIWLSIAHSKSHAIAQVVIEE
ncbi:4'-phosphopantetheinyl transferase [Pontibacillus chungwhensis BH030062]|uniref:Holo-[acyl-carrier-protein] synthase n=1 Tax=Pontibacillus chungwhensis BH030062 TaxID=1385513 RepID=A0A0A2UP69_9BACI|nr:holo-ACP synthase [Pontibacillus chungwhensis]KGP90087.1 4'-phosphopantetheinyl transferase [Pontibacillus chungwhensis BH030062]